MPGVDYVHADVQPMTMCLYGVCVREGERGLTICMCVCVCVCVCTHTCTPAHVHACVWALLHVTKKMLGDRDTH